MNQDDWTEIHLSQGRLIPWRHTIRRNLDGSPVVTSYRRSWWVTGSWRRKRISPARKQAILLSIVGTVYAPSSVAVPA